VKDGGTECISVRWREARRETSYDSHLETTINANWTLPDDKMGRKSQCIQR